MARMPQNRRSCGVCSQTVALWGYQIRAMTENAPVLVRHEAKYVIPIHLVDPIRAYIEPFCRPDPHGHSFPPRYTIVTLQLDGPGLPLHFAKREERLNRFKLRVRTYDAPGSPVFLEVKRKEGHVVIKSRARISRAEWGEPLLRRREVSLPFQSDKEYLAFLTFVRLAREIQAQPVVRIRYERESYFGVGEEYARVSFDRRLEYQPADDWDLCGDGGKWIAMDAALTQNKMNLWSGAVLELKSTGSAPRWMSNLTREFDLVRDGNCKYSTAVSCETVFQGGAGAPAYIAVLQDY